MNGCEIILVIVIAVVAILYELIILVDLARTCSFGRAIARRRFDKKLRKEVEKQRTEQKEGD